ncbi:hypothetical protein F5B21DRAFT_496710 [Xylaria acuta]|nr:hypothetical protein F5B21DRAFT_496710 [Xylaria acuta]
MSQHTVYHNITCRKASTATYDHTHWRTRDPVRSPIDKLVRGSYSVAVGRRAGAHVTD